MMRLDTPMLDRFAAALLQPASLAERGVHAPFTSPDLFAARLRQAPAKGLEAVVASPSGRRGFLVLPWSAALDACQPSLADRALVARLAGHPLTPAAMRAAAREVASEGLAGRAARRAAASGRTGPAPTGTGSVSPDMALPSLVAFAHGLVAWCPRAPAEADRGNAAALATRLGAAIQAAGAQADPARAAWLLDGWGLLAALWRVAEVEQRPALLRRCVALCPLPSEDMLAWPGCAGLAGLPPAPGPQLRLATQAQCEAALAGWLAPP